MRPFNNGKPQLSSSDRTRDIGSSAIFADTKSSKANPTNYDGSIVYDTANSRIKQYHSYALYRAVNYGYNFCEDCSGVCPTSGVDPDIQTENNQYSIMTFSLSDVIINASGDTLIENGGNLDGSGVFIDPSGILFGTSPCSTKSYLNYVRDLSGIDILGNDTNQNYLRCYSFPAKVKL
jgi:hypothetical protein